MVHMPDLDRQTFRSAVFVKEDGVLEDPMLGILKYDGRRPPWTVSAGKGGTGYDW